MPPARGLALALALLASGALLACVLAPSTPWTPVEHRPLTLALLTSWTLWRLHVLGHAWAQHRAWRQNTSWVLDAAALPSSLTTVPWLPVALRRRGPDRGVCLGRAFRWQAGQTQNPRNRPDPRRRPARGRG